MIVVLLLALVSVIFQRVLLTMIIYSYGNNYPAGSYQNCKKYDTMVLLKKFQMQGVSKGLCHPMVDDFEEKSCFSLQIKSTKLHSIFLLFKA